MLKLHIRTYDMLIRMLIDAQVHWSIRIAVRELPSMQYVLKTAMSKSNAVLCLRRMHES